MTKDFSPIAGVDEAGRGPLAGPVVAAAVILAPNCSIAGLNDSKKLSHKRRELLYDLIIEQADSYAIASASVAEIDKLNILQASLLAMQRAVNQLKVTPDEILVDGTFAPQVTMPARTIIKGDQKVASISAASILAKVTRDRQMLDYDKQYPGYYFANHKGYGTKAHLDALKQFGPCPIHRRSFSPVKQLEALV